MYYLQNYEWRGDVKWHYPEDKLKIAKKLGYKSILEAIVKLYYQKDSKEVAKIFSMHKHSLIVALRRRGFPIKSRGGPRAMADLYDIMGKKISKLTVMRFERDPKDNVVHYFCLCDCGRETKVRRSNLIKRNPIGSCMWCRKSIYYLEKSMMIADKNRKSRAGIQYGRLFM